MPVKCDRSGATFSATPCQLTQRLTRTPMAPILASVPGARGSATQMPTRPSRRSPRTPKRSSARISHSSSPCTKQRTSRAGTVPCGRVEVEHDVGDALARAVIGPLPAAPGGDRWENGSGRSGRPAGPRCRRCRAADAPPARPVRAPCRRGSPPRAPAWWRARPGRASGPSGSIAPFRRRSARSLKPRHSSAIPRACPSHGAVVAEW